MYLKALADLGGALLLYVQKLFVNKFGSLKPVLYLSINLLIAIVETTKKVSILKHVRAGKPFTYKKHSFSDSRYRYTLQGIDNDRDDTDPRERYHMRAVYHYKGNGQASNYVESNIVEIRKGELYLFVGIGDFTTELKINKQKIILL